MARKQVVEIECSRCDRTEYREGGPLTAGNIFEAKLLPEGPSDDALVVQYEDLCSPCLHAVKTLFEQIGKKIKGVSPDRSSRTEEKLEALQKSALPKGGMSVKAKKDEPTHMAPTHPSTPHASAETPSKNPAATRSA